MQLILNLETCNISVILQQAPNSMEVYLLIFIVLSPIIFMAACSLLKKSQREQRIRRYRSMMQNRKIDQRKILVAIQPLDIFVELSDTSKERFIQLQIQRSGIDKVINWFKKIFGGGTIYYKIKDKKLNTIAFLDSLLNTKRVELFLYTALQEDVAEILLEKLNLGKYFTKDRRRYCDVISEQLKHPTEIDSKIKRVIIITGSKTDHLEEDSQYFLVMKRKEVRMYGKALAELISRFENIDQFHQEFVQWKIDVESDYDSSHEKTQ